MEKNMAVILIIIIRISVIVGELTEKDNSEVYVTNSSSTYYNISPTCKLYGSDFSGELNGNVSINITYNGRFWIRAGIGFRRHLNHIGAMYSCAENYNNGITLDQCTSMCTTKYVRHNHKSCYCVNSNYSDHALTSIEPCNESECFLGKCVVYEKDVLYKRLRCGTHKFQNAWYYETEECKAELPYICENGQSNNRSYSWFLAHHYCKQQNSNLLQRNSGILNHYKDGRKYWISPFRRQVFLWQYDVIEALCVAGNLTDDGKLIPFIDFCNRTLPALCSVQKYMKTQTNAAHTFLKEMVIGVVCVVTLIIVVIVVIIVKKRRGCVCKGGQEDRIYMTNVNATLSDQHHVYSDTDTPEEHPYEICN